LPPNNINQILLSAVEESLSTLGDSSKQAIFYHLEASFQLKKENIPTNFKEFLEALEGIFGAGAPYLETLIAKHLHEKLGIEIDEKNPQNLAKCLEQLKKSLSLKEA
jgi:hypothetical protein